MAGMREGAIIRKFSTEWEVVQALLSFPAKSKTKITFTPPEGKAFVFDYSSTGSLVTNANITYSVFWDGTQAASFASGGALSDKPFNPGEAPLKVAMNSLQIVIDNQTDSAELADFIFFGFEVVLPELEDLLKELNGTKDREIQEDILKELKKISVKLGVTKYG